MRHEHRPVHLAVLDPLDDILLLPHPLLRGDEENGISVLVRFIVDVIRELREERVVDDRHH